nr:reverse transcriptase domain-containing protein [Tanacetum cinerariifolium]
MLQRCKDAHLVLNWEKCNFMVKEGIVLGHKVSSAGLEVDKAKINVILKLPPPTCIIGIRSFLGHVGFYRRFIRDFLKIARPLTKLLEKDTPFKFDDECQKAFELLKEKLTCAPMIVSPKWNLPFELMYNASDFAVGTILEIKDRKGTDNVATDHLSRIENDETSDNSKVDDNFPGETLMEINTKDEPCLINLKLLKHIIYPAFLITAEVLEIYMHQFWHTITKIKNSSSYKFKLDKKKCTIDIEVFLDILQICPRLPNQEFDAPPSDEEIITFIKELGHKGDIKSVTEVVVDQMHQPWRTFIDNRDAKKKEKMYYPRFTKAIIHHFISKDKSIFIRYRIFMHTVRDDSVLGTLIFVSKYDEYQVYGALLPEGMTNQQIRNSPAYKTYLAFTTGAATPKKAGKFQKHAFPSKKKTLVAIEEHVEKPAKKHAARRQSTGVQLEKLLEAQLKKAIKRSKWETNIHQVGGSSERVDLESKVPNEPKGKSIDTSKGIGLKSGVLDVSKADSSKIGYESYGDSDENEFVHTPNDYVPTDDENVYDEEYKRINKDMYDDVNTELKDTEPANEEKSDEEKTNAKNVNAEHEETSPLLTVHVTIILKTSSAPATTIPPPISPCIPLPQQSTPIPIPTPITTEATTSTIVVPDFETLSTIYLRVSNLEKKVKELKNVDHSSALHVTIKFKVLTVVKEYLGTSLYDALYKVKMEQAAKQQETRYTITSSDTVELQEFDQERTLFKMMTKTKSFNKNAKHKALYHALMESILEDKDAMDKGVANKSKKRKPDDGDRDKGPPARPDQGLKKKKTGKETKPSKKARSNGSSKGITKSQLKSTGKSTQEEETVFGAKDTQGL